MTAPVPGRDPLRQHPIGSGLNRTVLIATGGALLASAQLRAEPLTRDGAADEARRELQRSVYDEAKPPLLTRLIEKVIDALRHLLDHASSATPGGAFGLLALVLLGVVAVVVAVRLGPLRRPQSAAGGLDVPTAVTADQLRSSADELAARQQWAEAVRARLRAVVRSLEDRTLIEPRPGRTAYEVARDAGSAAPALRQVLEAAAGTFSEIWYGDRAATVDDYRQMTELDDAVRQHRPSSSAVARPTGPAVPA
jgi:hypothetical protein